MSEPAYSQQALEPTIGAKLGPFKVVSSSPNRLVLRGHRVKGFFIALGGLVIAAWGTILWLAILQNTVTGYFPAVALLFLPLGLLIFVNGVRQITAVWIFDGEQQAIIQSRRLGKSVRLHRSAFTGVELNFIPSSSSDYESVILQLMRLNIGTGASDIYVVIGDRRTRAAEAVNVVATAIQIARLLDLTLHVQGQAPVEGSPALLQAIAMAHPMPR